MANQRILDDIRNSYDGGTVERIHLLEKRDMYNIKRDFRIDYSTKWHTDDAVSVRLWVQKMKATNPCPVLFFKDQGEEHDVLQNDDFMLVIMNEFQEKQLIEFGGDKICIDGTHKMNNYHFQLFTLVVVNDYGNGMPVAFCFSNKGETKIFELFFESVKSQLQFPIKANVFMSDDDPSFYNAWADVMGPAKYKLLCSWHVHRNWLKNCSKISNSEKKKMVFQTLCSLMALTNEEEFRAALNQVLQDLKSDPDTLEYANYFEKTYCSRIREWAYCYRTHVGINTNMYLESLHKSIKHGYLEGKQCQRLDKAIDVLLKLVRDKAFEYMIKLSKKKASAKLQRILRSHERMTTIDLSEIEVLVDNEEWSVPSSNKRERYTVKRNTNCTTCTILICEKCAVCLHSFVCSCPDSAIYYNICKHIHALSHLVRSKNSAPAPQFCQIIEDIDGSSLIGSTAKEVNQTPTSLNEMLLTKFDMAKGLASKKILTSKETTAISNYTDRVLSVLNGSKNRPPIVRVPHNKKISLQKRSFFSTKKKVNVTTIRPVLTGFEKKCIQTALASGTEVINISSAFDHCYS